MTASMCDRCEEFSKWNCFWTSRSRPDYLKPSKSYPTVTKFFGVFAREERHGSFYCSSGYPQLVSDNDAFCLLNLDGAVPWKCIPLRTLKTHEFTKLSNGEYFWGDSMYYPFCQLVSFQRKKPKIWRRRMVSLTTDESRKRLRKR
jgi:hypothetical protein